MVRRQRQFVRSRPAARHPARRGAERKPRTGAGGVRRVLPPHRPFRSGAHRAAPSDDRRPVDAADRRRADRPAADRRLAPLHQDRAHSRMGGGARAGGPAQRTAPCRRNAPVAQLRHPRNLSDPLQRPPAQNLRGRRGLRRSHARQAASLRHFGRRRRGRSPRHQIQHAATSWSKWRWSRAACVST